MAPKRTAEYNSNAATERKNRNLRALLYLHLRPAMSQTAATPFRDLAPVLAGLSDHVKHSDQMLARTAQAMGIEVVESKRVKHYRLDLERLQTLLASSLFDNAFDVIMLKQLHTLEYDDHSKQYYNAVVDELAEMALTYTQGLAEMAVLVRRACENSPATRLRTVVDEEESARMIIKLEVWVMTCKHRSFLGGSGGTASSGRGERCLGLCGAGSTAVLVRH